MTTQLTKNYWLDVFTGWIESRDIPGPQNDEAMKVIDELKAAEARAAELERQLTAEQAAHKSDVEALRIELRLAYNAYHRAVHP